MIRLSAFFNKEDVKQKFPGVNIPGRLNTSKNIAPGTIISVMIQGEADKVVSSQWGEQGGGEAKVWWKNVWTNYTTRLPFRTNRCIIFIDSFYIWKDRKRSYRLYIPGEEVICAAGVYDENRSTLLVRKHDLDEIGMKRVDCPFVFAPEEAKAWLEEGTVSESIAILETASTPAYQLYRIDNRIQMPGYNHKDLHREISVVPSLFG